MTTCVTARVTRLCPFCASPGSRPEPNPAGLQRCPACGAAFWDAAWSRQQVRDHYDGYYHSDGDGFDPLTERRYHAILSRLEAMRRPAGAAGAPGRLLDVGCGLGHFLAVAEMRGWRGTGLEVSRAALDQLARLRTQRGFRFTLLGGGLREAALPAGGFDAVTLFEVLEHVDEPAALLAEAFRVLAPGGALYLTTPNYASLMRRLLGSRWRVVAPEHRCLATPAGMARCLTGAGFSVTRIATKNLDVAELAAKLRGREPAEHPTDRTSASQRLRRRMELVGWLRLLKNGANGALAASGLGETIEAMAVKRHTGPRP